ncbi:MAG: hypothetical protein PVSMB7_22960 [Chloroflexota bacterium]
MLGGHLPELLILLTIALGLYTTFRAATFVYRRLRERLGSPFVAAASATGTAIVLFLLGLWPLIAIFWCVRVVWMRGRAIFVQ